MAEPAFEVLARRHVRLLLAAAGEPAVVVETRGTVAEPARILVDGSLLETFAGGVVTTPRAYPNAERRWLVEAVTNDVTAFRLSH